jgi:hypothetical protein
MWDDPFQHLSLPTSHLAKTFRLQRLQGQMRGQVVEASQELRQGADALP